MEQIGLVIQQMINISSNEMEEFLSKCFSKTFAKKDIVSRPYVVPNEVFFINKGLLRIMVIDKEGIEHTIHFAMENQFIADYSCFIQKTPSIQTIQAIEKTETVVLPRSAIEWGYNNLREGDRLGRFVAEYYFIYHDNRIKNQYVRTPKERYDNITEVFPNIHNRVPQHMIASYLGITPIHLSRLKKSASGKS
jgi:CRP-like cAMP-binding protein